MSEEERNVQNNPLGKPSQETSLIRDLSLEEAAIRVDLRKVIRGIFLHIPVILTLAIISTAIASYMSYKYLHTYFTEAVLIFPEQHNVVGEGKYQILHLNSSSAAEMITLPVNIKAVKSILGLDLSIEEITKMVKVEPPSRGSNLITIKVTANNPNLALDISNTLANVVVKGAQELTQKQWQEAYTYFKNQEEVLRQKIAEQNKKIQSFKETNGLAGKDVSALGSSQELKSAEQKLQEANLRYTQLLVEYENLKREYSKIPEQVEQTLGADYIKTRLAQTEESLLEARTRFAPENPKIKALEAQIQALQKMTKEKSQAEEKNKVYVANPVREKLDLELVSLQARLRAAQKFKEEVAEFVEQAKQNAGKLGGLQIAFTDLMDQKANLENQLRGNTEAQRSIEIILNLGKGDIELYQAADKVFSYDTFLWVDFLPLTGFLAGIASGIGVALFLELKDTKIRTVKQIELFYKIPCLTAIPEEQKGKKNLNIILYIRALVERLQMQSQTFSSLAITSSREGEGKSYLAHELAQYFSQKKKVLLMEFDYRSKYSKEEKSPNALLENYLRGKAAVEDIILKNQPDRIKAGNDSEMKELLKTEAMKKLWASLTKSYEIIIIDTPGILEDEYAINAAAIAEECLYVVGSSIVEKQQVDASMRHLEIYGIKPCGIVLNRVLPIYMVSQFGKTEKEEGVNWKELLRKFPHFSESSASKNEKEM